MTPEERSMLLSHYDVLAAFNEDYYKDLITKNHLGEETFIKVNEEQLFIYPVKYRGKLFAIPSKVIELGKLPIKIASSDKIAYRTYVYHLVNEYASARIKEEEILDWRTLVDTLANFKHTHKDLDFLIYKIAMLTLYIRKGFIRVVSEAAFGKNSIPTIIKTLMTDVAIVNPRSTPSFEHKLINKFVVLDELTNLEKGQRDLMQEALLRVADWSPSYEKGTRGSVKLGTKDEYDISKLSIAVLYNVFQYYLDVGQQDKYFDNIFQHAVKDRFFPIKCDGVLDGTQFMTVPNPKQIAEELKDDIKNIIRSIKFYQLHFEEKEKDFRLFESYKLSKSGRIDKTFNVICQGIKMYANDELEYNRLVKHLVQMHNNYNEMVMETKLTEIDLSELEPVATGSKQSSLQSYDEQK